MVDFGARTLGILWSAWYYCIIALVLGVVSSCATTPTDQTVSGYWEQRGYNRVTLYAENKAQNSWVVGADYCYEMAPHVKLIDRIEVLNADTVTGYAAGGITKYQFDRRPAPPESCLSTEDYHTSDPEKVFDVFWAHFYDNYRFFETYGVDWKRIYTSIRPTISQHSSEEDLWTAIQTSLAGVADGHISISRPNGDYWSPGRLTPYLRALERRLPKMNSTTVDDAEDEFEAEYPSFAAGAYLNEELGRAFDDTVLWGTVEPGVGYLLLMAMEFTNTGIAADDVAAAVDLFDNRILPDLKDHSSLVVDIQLNGGGQDATALAIASRLASRDCVAFSKASPGSFYPSLEQSITVVPTQNALRNKKTVVLVSSETASAAEIFLLAMRAQPHVLVVGEASEGVLSDTWPGILPNGWKIRLSNELYLSPAKTSYESKGIPADIPLNTFQEGDMLDGLTKAFYTGLEKVQYIEVHSECRVE